MADLEFVVMAKKVLCDKCSGLCCRYFALPIETPEDRGDYDDIRWYLCHKDITVFVEDGDWYINIKNKCKHLSEKDNRCKIYDKRPRICRQYRHRTCDLVEGEYDYELHFTSNKQMEEYIKIKFSDNVMKKPKVKSKKAKGKKRKK
jgi:Fe-S-cluster containining protein